MLKKPRSPTTKLTRCEYLDTGDEDRAKTMVVTACRTCGVRLHEGNNFCRWCGAPQASDLTVRLQTSLTTPHPVHLPEQCCGFNSTYHLVSGPLVKAIAETVPATLALQRRDRFLQGVIQTLVLVPIWLMFVLLSPFDAYAAARNLTKGG